MLVAEGLEDCALEISVLRVDIEAAYSVSDAAPQTVAMELQTARIGALIE